MSYQNPLIIQNKPYENLGKAANQAAASIQDAILFNMEKQEKKQEEIAKKQAIDDANAIAAAKESSTEAAAARKTFNANEYSSIGIEAWEGASDNKFKYNQIVANVNATREERLAAQNAINAENTFQQNQVGALAYLSEDRQEYMELKAKGNVYSTGGLNGVYVKFLEGDPNVKLTGKRVGNDWVNTLTYDGKSYELPTDKIKDGSFEAFALTPDLYEGVDDQAKEINAARSKREKGMQEFTPNDLSGITEAVNVNIDKAAANFDSYLKMDPMKAKAVLANSVYPELSEADIDKKMEVLQAGGLKGAAAQIEVREEMKKDIEYKWGMNTGVFRNAEGNFEVMKPEEKSDLSRNPARGGTAEWTLNQEIADLKYKAANVNKTNYLEVLDIKNGVEEVEDTKWDLKTTINNNTVTISKLDPSDMVTKTIKNEDGDVIDEQENPREVKLSTYNLTNKSDVMSYLRNQNKYSTGTYAELSKLADKIVEAAKQ